MPASSTRTRLDAVRLLRALALAVGALYLAGYVAVAMTRMAFPFDIEVLEGTILEHVHRVLEGESIYPAPSVEFVPTLYMPGYYYVSAVAASWLGETFLALRVVSFLSSMAAIGTIFAFVRRETRDGVCAMIAACFFAATFRRVGAWFDIARPDSLCVACLMVSVYWLRFGRGVPGGVVAGVAFAAACVTKQTGLLLGVPLAIAVFLRDRREALGFALTSAVLIGAAGAALEYASSGWFTRYTLVTTPFDISRTWDAGPGILLPFGFAWAAAAWLIWNRREAMHDVGAAPFFAAMTIGWLAATSYVALHKHTAENSLIPVVAWLAIAAGVALHAFGADSRDRRLLAAVYACVVVQFAALAYNPWRQLPTTADLAGGQALVEAIRSIDGPVLVFERPYLARRAGKPGHAARVTLLDAPSEEVRRVHGEIEADIRAGRYGAVVLVHRGDFSDALAGRYRPAESILPEASVPRAVAGGEPNPNLLFRRNGESTPISTARRHR